MTDEKKADAKPTETVHTVATVKVRASDVQQWVARSAMTSHDFGPPNEAGLRKCSFCGRLAPAGEDAVTETCPKAPAQR
jgi:hypothetical protein